MRAIPDIEQIRPGDVLYHQRRGLMMVDHIAGEYVGLHRPPGQVRRPHSSPFEPLDVVPALNIVSEYRLCHAGGFLHRFALTPMRLRARLEENPLAVITLLVDDLDREVTPDELRGWMVDCDLLSERRYRSWWTRLLPSLEGSPLWDGEQLLPLPTAGTPEDDALVAAFVLATPRARYELLRNCDAAARTRLLEGCLEHRCEGGLLALLPLYVELPDALESALVELALTERPALTAVLMLHPPPVLLVALAERAANPRHRGHLQSALLALSETPRISTVMGLIELALSGSGGEVAALFLSDQLPVSPGNLLDSIDAPGSRWLELRSEWAAATDWLHSRVAESTLDCAPPKVDPLLTALRPLPAGRLFPLAIAVARVLAARHAAGDTGGLAGARVGEGDAIVLGVSEASTPLLDVLQVMRTLTLLAVGRLPCPPELDSDGLLAHVKALVPDIGPEWTAVASRAMSPDPAWRPRDALDLWEQLEQAYAIARVRAGAPRRAQVRMDIGGDTHIGAGKTRGQTNQDAMFWRCDGAVALAVVADGISVSTAGSGDRASAIAVRVLAERWSQRHNTLEDATPERIARFLRASLAMVNKEICEATLEAAGGRLGSNIPMGTTVVIALFQGDRVHLASLGDSRVYLVSSAGAGLLTADQNVGGMLLESWQRGESPKLGGEGSALVGYLGHFDETGRSRLLEPQITCLTLLPGETLVLCSDGLTDYAATTGAEICTLLESAARERDLNAAARTLTNRANARGGGDNVTVVLARQKLA